MATKEITYKIVKHIGTISKKDTYEKTLNILSWNGNAPVFDLRLWKIGTDKSCTALKGITLTKEELLTLKELLSNIDLEV